MRNGCDSRVTSPPTQSASWINAYVRIVDKCVCDYACHIRGNTETSTAGHALGIKSDSFCMGAKTRISFDI